MNKQHDNIIQEPYYPASLSMLKLLRLAKLTASEWNVWSYLTEIDIQRNDFVSLDPLDVIDQCHCSKATFYRAIAKLKEKQLIPDWVDYNFREVNSIESKVRDNLQSQLGGLTEVTTLSGRIDLLTDTEIIEVKNIKDWKAALGQILVYSAFYPNHKKRIHLFGENIDNLADLELSCLPFDVAVTGELI